LPGAPDATPRPMQQPPVSAEGYLVPRGGSYVHGGDVANLPEDTMDVLRVTAFDAVRDAIVIGGRPLHPDAITFPWRVFDHNGSMTLLLDGDGAIVLRGVPQVAWAAGVLAQRQGTTANDVMVGDGSAEVFVPGSGLDQVSPAAGDDRISFASGYLVVSNDPPNLGDDTLDLRRFAGSDIVTSVEGYDVLIFTADGTIRLSQQFSPGLGGNVERVLFADDDIWGIASRADFGAMIGGN
jgi:hypothetical protein